MACSNGRKTVTLSSELCKMYIYKRNVKIWQSLITKLQLLWNRSNPYNHGNTVFTQVKLNATVFTQVKLFCHFDLVTPYSHIVKSIKRILAIMVTGHCITLNKPQTKCTYLAMHLANDASQGFINVSVFLPNIT